MWPFKQSIDKLESKRDICGLVRALGDRDPDNCKRAADALVAIGPDAVPVLIKTLGDTGEDSTRRYNVAWVLGKLRATEAIPDFIACLKDTNRSVQQGACLGLGMLRERSAVPALLACVDQAASLWTKAFAIANVMKIVSPDVPDMVVNGLVSLLPRIAAWQQLLREGNIPADLQNELRNAFAVEGDFIAVGAVDPVDSVRTQLSLFVERNILPAFEDLGKKACPALIPLATRRPASATDAYNIHYAALALAQIPQAFPDVLVSNASNGNMDGALLMMKASARTARQPCSDGRTPWQWASANRHEDLLDLLGQFGIDS